MSEDAKKQAAEAARKAEEARKEAADSNNFWAGGQIR